MEDPLMAKELDPDVALGSTDPLNIPKGMPETNATERMWAYVILNPHVDSRRLIEAGFESGLPKGTAGATPSILKTLGRLKITGTVRHPNPKVGKYITTLVACGRSRSKELQAWLDTIPGLVYCDLVKPGAPAPTPAASAPSPFPPPLAAPVVTIDKRPVHRVATQFPPRVIWNPNEKWHVCKVLADDEVRFGVVIDHKRVAEVAKFEGLGYRPKHMYNVPDRVKFLDKNKLLIMQLQAEIAEQVKHEQEEAEKATHAPAVPWPVQPPPEPLIASFPSLADPYDAEDQPVPQVTRIRDVTPTPADDADDEPMRLIMRGVMGLVRNAIRDVVREEVARIPAPTLTLPGNLLAALDTLNDNLAKTTKQVDAMVSHVVTVVEKSEASIRLNAMTRGDPQVKLAQVLTPKPPPPPPAPEVYKPRVIVLGGMSRDWEQIKQRLATRVKLVFYDGARSPVERPEDIDLVVIFTKFVSHTAVKNTRKKYGDKHAEIHGGAETISQFIAQRLGIPYISSKAA